MKMGIKLKLFLAMISMLLVVIASIGVVSFVYSRASVRKVVLADLENLTNAVRDSLYIKYNSDMERLKYNLIYADTYLTNNFSINKESTVEILSINQDSNLERYVKIPQLRLNDKQVLGDYTQVDNITNMTGCTATIFQFFSEGMIRVTTSVRNEKGERAVGTYIPSSSPVFQSIAKGETYYGKANVLKDLYTTAYKPIFDNNRQVIGAIYVGLKLDKDQFRKEILSIKIGETGYIWVLDNIGVLTIHPVIEGNNLYNTTDDRGYYFVRDIIEKKNGMTYYWWQNEGENKAREKIIVFRHLKELDWYIAPSAYTEEVYRDANKIGAIIIIISIISLIVATIIILVIAFSLANPINKVSKELSSGSSNLESAAYQISSSSQELSSGSSELASSIEEITSSIEELQSVIESNTKNINQSEIMMRETNEGSREVTDKMKELQQALVEINDNSRRIVKIIKVIEDIAFQTNILALNAAVEAARAGEAGRGFAVVADQVKSLAQKSSEAAKETAQLIENAIESVGKGDSLGKIVFEFQSKAGEMTEKVSTLLDEVNRASKEQMKGVNQISQAVSQTNSVVQQTASSAEETAAASEELLTQAEGLNNIVDTLNLIVMGKILKKTTIDKNKNEHKTIKQLPETKQKSNEIELVKPEDKIPLEDFNDF